MINFKNNQLSFEFCLLPQQSSKPDSTKSKRDKKINIIKSKVINLLLGIAAIIIFIPILVIIFLLGIVIPQKKWQEF